MKNWIKAHYHWVIAAVVLIEMTIYGGLVNNLSSMYLIPVTTSFGVSRSTYSLTLSLRSLLSFLSGMFSSVMFLRFGYRKLVTVGLVGGALALLLMSNSRGIIGIGFGMFMLGVCESMYSTIGVTKVIGDWFHKHRGKVLGLVTAATGIGGSLFCMIQSRMIQKSGWSSSYRFSALMLVLTAALMVLVVRNRPDDLKLRPYGEGTLPKKNRHRGGVAQDNWPGYSLGELIRRPTFILMIAGTFLSSFCLYMAFYVVVPHVQDCGLSATQAATLQSVMLLSLAVSKLLTGSLSDLIGGKNVTLVCLTCGIAGLWLLSSVSGMANGAAAVAIFSMGLPLTSLTIPMLNTQLFGYRAHDTATGLFMSIVAVGGMVATPVCNIAYDLLGSYRPVFRAAAILALATMGLFFVLYRMADRDRKKWYAEREEQKQG